MSAVVFRWSASAPVPSVQPSANIPHVASSITSIGVRPVRVISRIDCCGKIGAMAAKPPTARTARTWPGVARPRRSPRPAEVRVPSGRGRSHSRCRRSAAAFFGETGPTRTVPAAEPVVSPSKSSSIREAPEGAPIASAGPAFRRAIAHSAPAPSTREAVTRSRFVADRRSLTGGLLPGLSADAARRRPSLGAVQPLVKQWSDREQTRSHWWPRVPKRDRMARPSADPRNSPVSTCDQLGTARPSGARLDNPGPGQYNSACRPF